MQPGVFVPLLLAALAASLVVAQQQQTAGDEWSSYTQRLASVSIGDVKLGDKLGRVLNYQYGTPLALIQDSNVYTGGNARYRRVVNDLLNGKEINVVAIGGVATNGSDATQAGTNDYTALFASYLKSAFPTAKINVVRKSAGIAPSSVVLSCSEAYLPDDADLVLLEMTASDAAVLADPISNAQPPMVYEALVRKVLKGSRQPALLLTQSMVPGAGNGTTPFYLTPECPHYAAVAGYYDVPTVSMRNALWEDSQVSPQGLLKSPAVLASDGSTPLDRGHKSLADTLVYLTQRTARDLVLLPFGKQDTESLDGDVPATPIYRGILEKEESIVDDVACSWVKNITSSDDCPGSASDLCGLDFSSKQAFLSTYSSGSGSSRKGSKKGPNMALLGGIIGGVLGGLALIAGLLAYCIISRRKQQARLAKRQSLPIKDGSRSGSRTPSPRQQSLKAVDDAVAVPISADTRA